MSLVVFLAVNVRKFLKNRIVKALGTVWWRDKKVGIKKNGAIRYSFFGNRNAFEKYNLFR